MTDRLDPVLPPAPPQRPPRVLIAEDDPAAANVLQTLLGRVGYEVIVAQDGASVLEMLEAGPSPDVLLLDWMLPEISGLEVCYRVRAKWDPLMLPILMVTAKTDAESISAAFDAGASDYLTKPFLGAELRARIAAHLRVKQLLEERMRFEEHLKEREKLSTLGLLVSGVAHDLNNPLGGISGYTQLLLEEESDPRKLEALQQIMGEVQRCNRIVGELLSFSRRRPVEQADFDVNDVLQRTMRLRERQIQSSGLRSRVDLDEGLPQLRGDPHQLQQVFLNILVNGEQALRQGGERIEVRAHRAAPASADAPGREWVVVTFFNDGPPIPADILPRIFEPFFTTKGEDEGTGLGLSICRRIVREHGGEIDAESGPDGTTFRVRLPVR
jgi:signal transduction histidine kinase